MQCSRELIIEFIRILPLTRGSTHWIRPVQDLSQLKKDYGKEQADVIMNIVGNVISGQVMGETTDQLSKRFGRINQDEESFSINSVDTSVSRSRHLDFAISASTISTLSSGEFVGMVADDPDQKIELKIFHADIINSQNKIKMEERKFLHLPRIRDLTPDKVQNKYISIKKDIESIIESQLSQMIKSPIPLNLIIKKRVAK